MDFGDSPRDMVLKAGHTLGAFISHTVLQSCSAHTSDDGTDISPSGSSFSFPAASLKPNQIIRSFTAFSASLRSLSHVQRENKTEDPLMGHHGVWCRRKRGVSNVCVT